MERFETESLALLSGQRVRVRVTSHQRWGFGCKIVGYEALGASVDMIELFGRQIGPWRVPRPGECPRRLLDLGHSRLAPAQTQSVVR
jgi:hypothetical protein